MDNLRRAVEVQQNERFASDLTRYPSHERLARNKMIDVRMIHHIVSQMDSQIDWR